MFEDILLELLIRGVLATLLAIVGSLVWSLAQRVAASPMIERFPSFTNEPQSDLSPSADPWLQQPWQQVLGKMLTFLGLFGLVIVILGLAFDTLVNQPRADQQHLYLLCLCLCLTTAVAMLIVNRGWRAPLRSFRSAVRPDIDDDLEEPPTVTRQLGELLTNPLFLCLCGAAILTVLGLVTLIDNDTPHLGLSQAGAYSLLFAGLGYTVITVGLTYLTVYDLSDIKQQPLMHWQRRTLAQLVRVVASLLYFQSLVCFGWFSPLICLLMAIVLFSSLGGRSRFIQLSLFWTLVNAVRSGVNVTRALRRAAALLPKSVRRRMYNAASELEHGEAFGAVVCRRHLVPRACWLECRSADYNGALERALHEMATRETERFSRECEPGTPRAYLGYFGIVGGILFANIAFLGHSLVPKFKKIYADFDAKIDSFSLSAMSLVSSNTAIVTSLILAFGCLIVGLTAESLVDYFGWRGVIERIGGIWGVRQRTPDLLRGIRWAVLQQRPLAETLQVMSSAPVGPACRALLQQAAVAIRNGEDPWVCLQRSGWLSRREVELLQSAQAAGHLPWALQTLSESIEARTDYRLAWWLQMLHPAMILAKYAVTVLLALVLLSPMFALILGIDIDLPMGEPSPTQQAQRAQP